MDIIAAIATGSARTAIGIVRLSGEGCFALCDRVFAPAGGVPLSAAEPRKLLYGAVLDRQGRVIDRALAVRFPAPASYTGEDCAELQCHGSPAALGELMDALCALGARQARPGEFTRRAFLNGRMDLTEAEGVIDLIDAETAAAARNAAGQLSGSLRRGIEGVYDALAELSARFCAVVDYPDEDLEDVQPAQIMAVLKQAEGSLGRLLATCDRGRVLKSGVAAAIVGRPNAGKSSLLNALAGFDRSIVTSLPGTTRDTVEERVVCGGVLLRLIDTAGLRETEDAVEKLGVERARAALERAELALAVVDHSVGLTAEDEAVLKQAGRCRHWILVWSKCDLPMADGVRCVEFVPGAAPAAIVSVSSVTGEGLDELEAAVAELFPAGDAPAGGVLTNARQEEAVSRARDAVRRALEALEIGLTPDAALTDVEEALSALGELTGKTVREDIVSRIFARFCVGK